MLSNKIGRPLQESLLALLIYDNTNGGIVAKLLDAANFDGDTFVRTRNRTGSEGRNMTENEWLTCQDPHAMLRFLRPRVHIATNGQRELISNRKLHLFVGACYERCGSINPEVERGLQDGWPNPIIDMAVGWAQNATAPPPHIQTHLLRDIVGNPLRPVELPYTWKSPEPTYVHAFAKRKRYESCPWLRWNGGSAERDAHDVLSDLADYVSGLYAPSELDR